MTAAAFLVPTYSGKLVDLLSPQPGQISREAIAHHLANSARWCGATDTHYSVAQHSLLVSSTVRLPRAKIYGLLHRAAEYVLGQVPAEFRQLLAHIEPQAERAFCQIHNNLDEAIWQHFELDMPDEAIIAAIADANRVVTATEWRDRLPAQAIRSPYAGIKTLTTPITPQNPGFIEFMFLDRLDALLGVEANRRQQAAE